MPPISIIIPNYNGAHLLKKNLPSVIRFSQVCDSEISIIVVDDGSSDSSIEVLATYFSQVTVVVHAENKGFSEAIASGVHAASSELVFLLNSDVELVEDIFTPLLSYFDDDHTFSVCPLMRNELGVVSRHSWNLRALIKGRLKIKKWTWGAACNQRQQAKLPTLYSSGGSMMVRRSMLLALGCFHPIYKPFYGEDFDLGLRAWCRGWPSYFEPNVSVIHQEKGSIAETSKKQRIKRVQRRNRYFVEWIHLPITTLVFITLPISILQLLGEVILLDKTNLQGFWSAIKQLPDVCRARQALKDQRTLSLTEILDRVAAI